MTQSQDQSLKQQIAEYYTGRSHNYDKSDYHTRLAALVLQLSQINPGHTVLDVACGTGLLSIPAAKMVGASGLVIGLDISDGMLSQAREKVSAGGISNLELRKEDAEHANFPANTFDRIICSSALTFFSDVPALISRWYNFLKPGGILVFDNPSKVAFITGVILKEAATQFGVNLAFGNECGTEERCRTVMQNGGFDDISIATEQFGNYMKFEDAASGWDSFLTHPLSSPLRQLPDNELNHLKETYLNQMAKLLSHSHGKQAHAIWNDGTMFLVRGRKPY